MAVTYDPIATNTLSSPTTTLTFSSIPNTYTDLIIVANLGASSAANVGLQFNGDNGANYSGMIFYGGGSGVPASGTYPNINQSYGLNGALALPSSIIGSGWINIFSYAKTNAFKTSLSRYSYATGAELTNFCSTWRSTAAINSIRVFSYSGDYLAGSSFTLYGIRAA